MSLTHPEDILQFWFPDAPESDHDTMARRMGWWFGGGADNAILEHYGDLPDRGARGDLDDWAAHARSRLALIVVLDQFSRTVYRNTARAYAQDPKARALTREGLLRGHYAELHDPWQKTFFLLPLAHSENIDDVRLAVQLASLLPYIASPAQRRLLEHAAGQARAHREVVERFGRQPHRNQALGRVSTPEELEYLAASDPANRRVSRG